MIRDLDKIQRDVGRFHITEIYDEDLDQMNLSDKSSNLYFCDDEKDNKEVYIKFITSYPEFIMLYLDNIPKISLEKKLLGSSQRSLILDKLDKDDHG